MQVRSKKEDILAFAPGGGGKVSLVYEHKLILLKTYNCLMGGSEFDADKLVLLSLTKTVEHFNLLK